MAKIRLNEAQLTSLIREALDELSWETMANAQKGIINRVEDYKNRIKAGESLSDEEMKDYKKKSHYLKGHNMDKYDDAIQRDFDERYPEANAEWYPVGNGHNSDEQVIGYNVDKLSRGDNEIHHFDGMVSRPISPNSEKKPFKVLDRDDDKEAFSGRPPREIAGIHHDAINAFGPNFERFSDAYAEDDDEELEDMLAESIMRKLRKNLK